MFAPALQVSMWMVLMAATLLGPPLLGSSRTGDFHVKLTIDLALAYYVLAVVRMLISSRGQWLANGDAVRAARLSWSLAWLAYVIHVLLAFHHAHGWSHSHAMRHTEEVSHFAEGIFVSHFFTVLWGADVAWWWMTSDSYVRRPVVLGWAIHAFMAFIILNGTVIFESGPVRWVGAVASVALIGLLLYRLRLDARSRPSPP